MGSTPGDGAFHEDFDGPALDTDVWVPHYLPMWSSRAESAATYALADSELRLTIPPEQSLWRPGDHPLRVSGLQSGVFSVRARMDLSPRSMAAVWMVGLEDEPDRCGEICVFEVFGDAVDADGGRPSAAVGMGVHPFRDPALTEEWGAGVRRDGRPRARPRGRLDPRRPDTGMSGRSAAR